MGTRARRAEKTDKHSFPVLSYKEKLDIIGLADSESSIIHSFHRFVQKSPAQNKQALHGT
jgi:hypothetical protein